MKRGCQQYGLPKLDGLIVTCEVSVHVRGLPVPTASTP